MATIDVSINKRALERVKAKHLWIYKSDVVDTGSATGGEVVRVIDSGGKVVGWALYSSLSQISLRFVSFNDVRIDRDFWISRLTTAQKLRQQVVTDTNAYRVIYGESDLLPSLIVDRYADCLVIQTLSQGMDALRETWIEILAESYSPKAIIERNESRVRDLEGLPRRAGVVHGQTPPELIIEEGRIRFAANLIEGQKTGAFLDQRENRIAAAGYSAGRVLDCFSFEGAFALHLAKDADSVLGVDISAAAIERGRRNASLNEISNIEFVEANAFDLLKEMEGRGERFNLINLDPPAFARNRASVEAAVRGYKEINLRAIKMLRGGGTLVTSTCSYHMSEEMFLNCIASAASDAGRSVQILERRGQARDHPVLASMPETHYLKCVVARVE